MSPLQNVIVINNAHKYSFLIIKVFKMQNVVVGYETNLTEVTDEVKSKL